MPVYSWAAILAFAEGVVTLALRIMDAIEGAGCTVEGCPKDVRALPRERAPDLAGDWASGINKLDKMRSGIK